MNSPCNIFFIYIESLCVNFTVDNKEITQQSNESTRGVSQP